MFLLKTMVFTVWWKRSFLVGLTLAEGADSRSYGGQMYQHLVYFFIILFWLIEATMLKSCKLQKVGVECAGLEQTQLPHGTLKIPTFSC